LTYNSVGEPFGSEESLLQDSFVVETANKGNQRSRKIEGEDGRYLDAEEQRKRCLAGSREAPCFVT
jgi:hypothetical protein